MSNEETNLQNIWTFMKHSKATQNASLKVLQQFVLSLSKQSLAYLIECYLISKLPKYQQNGLTHQQSIDKFINKKTNKKDDNKHKLDTEILTKLNKNYGKKYNKKIVQKIQQNNDENPKHILSLHAEVLAYSFQFLSYKEQSKYEIISSYFLYSLRQFKGISHYSITLNRKFWNFLFKNHIDVNNLTQFKQIRITAAHFGSKQMSFRKPIERKRRLFWYFLHKIITQNVSSLRVLEINLKYVLGTVYVNHHSRDNGNVLSFILDKCAPECPDSLLITKLIWGKDFFVPHSNITQIISNLKDKIYTKLPYLTEFDCRINHLMIHFAHEYRWQNNRNPLLLSLFPCIKSLVVNNDQLTVINLDFPLWNILENDDGILTLIMKLKNISKLSICSNTDATDHGITTYVRPYSIINKSLEELNVRLATNVSVIEGESAKRGLITLLSSFINIKCFSFKIGYCGPSCSEVNLNIDWQFLFNILIRNKNKYKLNSLISCEFDGVYYMDAVNIIKMFKIIKDDKYVNMKKFGLKVFTYINASDLNQRFNEFMNESLIPLIKLYKDDNLHDLNVSYGNRRSLSLSSELFFGSEKYLVSSNIRNEYYQPIIDLLNNIPKSLKRLKLKVPKLKVGGDRQWRNASGNVVKTLCQMTINKDNMNLEQIRLRDLKLESRADTFLIFFFGFNRKLFQSKKDYFISFL